MVQRRHQLNLRRRPQQPKDWPELLSVRSRHRGRERRRDLAPGREEREAYLLRRGDGDGVVDVRDRGACDSGDLGLELGERGGAVEDVRRAEGFEVGFVGGRCGGDDGAKAGDFGELDG